MNHTLVWWKLLGHDCTRFLKYPHPLLLVYFPHCSPEKASFMKFFDWHGIWVGVMPFLFQHTDYFSGVAKVFLNKYPVEKIFLRTLYWQFLPVALAWINTNRQISDFLLCFLIFLFCSYMFLYIMGISNVYIFFSDAGISKKVFSQSLFASALIKKCKSKFDK